MNDLSILCCDHASVHHNEHFAIAYYHALARCSLISMGKYFDKLGESPSYLAIHKRCLFTYQWLKEGYLLNKQAYQFSVAPSGILWFRKQLPVICSGCVLCSKGKKTSYESSDSQVGTVLNRQVKHYTIFYSNRWFFEKEQSKSLWDPVCSGHGWRSQGGACQREANEGSLRSYFPVTFDMDYTHMLVTGYCNATNGISEFLKHGIPWSKV